MKIPQGHQRMMPYLIVNNAEGLIDFLKAAFDAKENYKKMRDASTIMHAELSVGDQTIMMADSTKDWESQPAGLFIYVEDADKTYEAALKKGATSIMPVSDEDYGRSGGVRDPFGNIWWITSVK